MLFIKGGTMSMFDCLVSPPIKRYLFTGVEMAIGPEARGL